MVRYNQLNRLCCTVFLASCLLFCTTCTPVVGKVVFEYKNGEWKPIQAIVDFERINDMEIKRIQEKLNDDATLRDE